MRFQDQAPQLPANRNLIRLRRKTYKLRLVSIRPACDGCRYGYQIVTFICEN
jgi:hypothetical protein